MVLVKQNEHVTLGDSGSITTFLGSHIFVSFLEIEPVCLFEACVFSLSVSLILPPY